MKNLSITGARDLETKSKLLEQLSKVTILPRVANGEAVSSKVAVTLK